MRHAWSAAWACQVEATDQRTGERLTLLSEDHWDDHLARAACAAAH